MYNMVYYESSHELLTLLTYCSEFVVQFTIIMFTETIEVKQQNTW